jgi:hypothetical protein
MLMDVASPRDDLRLHLRGAAIDLGVQRGIRRLGRADGSTDDEKCEGDERRSHEATTGRLST